jgi:hypothetical protein
MQEINYFKDLEEKSNKYNTRGWAARLKLTQSISDYRILYSVQ